MQVTLIGAGGVPAVTTLENQDIPVAGSVQAVVKNLSAFVSDLPPQVVSDAALASPTIASAVTAGTAS